MFDFHASDLGTQIVSNSKYYWQNEKAKCCVLVQDSSRDNLTSPVTVYFLQLTPGMEVLCTNIQSPDDAVVQATEGRIVLTSKTIDRPEGKCIRPDNCGKIMNAIFDLIDNNSWSFPRAKATKPYITKESAELFENDFKTMVSIPIQGCLYATIAKAGTLLMSRLGINPDIIFSVNHYVTETNTQDDSRIEVKMLRNVDVSDKPVIVVDDLISSGRTANAVIEQLLKSGASRVYYFALYRTICSKEVELWVDPRVCVKSFLPISNAYWTYGRGFDLTDEKSRCSNDIYASTKHWDWETDSDVEDLIRFFGPDTVSFYEYQ